MPDKTNDTHTHKTRTDREKARDTKTLSLHTTNEVFTIRFGDRGLEYTESTHQNYYVYPYAYPFREINRNG